MSLGLHDLWCRHIWEGCYDLLALKQTWILWNWHRHLEKEFMHATVHWDPYTRGYSLPILRKEKKNRFEKANSYFSIFSSVNLCPQSLMEWLAYWGVIKHIMCNFESNILPFLLINLNKGVILKLKEPMSLQYSYLCGIGIIWFSRSKIFPSSGYLLPSAYTKNYMNYN